jgi:hypothetical protein
MLSRSRRSASKQQEESKNENRHRLLCTSIGNIEATATRVPSNIANEEEHDTIEEAHLKRTSLKL